MTDPDPRSAGSDRPSSGIGPTLLQSLMADFAWQAKERALLLVFGALEHLLEQQNWARARLARHAGLTVRVGLELSGTSGAAAPSVRATIDEDGLLRRSADSVRPDASLWVSPSVDAIFALLQEGSQGLQRHLRIEGEVTLAATLGELAEHLRWDAEEDLSRVVGDVAAHRAMTSLRAAVHRVRDFGGRARESSTRFAMTGTQLVVRPQLQSLSEEAERLDQQLRRLQARVDRLMCRAAS